MGTGWMNIVPGVYEAWLKSNNMVDYILLDCCMTILFQKNHF